MPISGFRTILPAGCGFAVFEDYGRGANMAHFHEAASERLVVACVYGKSPRASRAAASRRRLRFRTRGIFRRV